MDAGALWDMVSGGLGGTDTSGSSNGGFFSDPTASGGSSFLQSILGDLSGGGGAAALSGGLGIFDLLSKSPNSSSGITAAAATAADPFASQRGQYQSELSSLLADPSSVTKNPLYQFQMSQGVGAIDASAGAKGLLGSGKEAVDLETFGQGLASQSFNTMVQLLTGLSGANTGSPATAGTILSGQLQNRNDAAANVGASSGGGGGLGGILGDVASVFSSFF